MLSNPVEGLLKKFVWEILEKLPEECSNVSTINKLFTGGRYYKRIPEGFSGEILRSILLRNIKGFIKKPVKKSFSEEFMNEIW